MDFTKFQSLLDDQIEWPSSYMFKFVAKTEQKDKVIKVLSECEIFERPSKTGKYTSITGKKHFNSSDEVITIYRSMAEVEGIVSL